MATKRMRYSETSASDTESDDLDMDYVHENYNNNKSSSGKRKTREPKSFSRNALMARENRLKKKLYMENLERELSKERTKNKKYTSILKEQAEIMDKQEREIKYMRGILANNSDICKLLKTIHNNTGLSVGTSLNTKFTINSTTNGDNYNKSPADVIVKEIHPWSDAQFSGCGGLSLSTSDSDLGIFDDFHLPALDLPLDDVLDADSAPVSPLMDEHNYTMSSGTDLGVCLHISNSKVSLEYCAQCHENSSKLWSEEDPF